MRFAFVSTMADWPWGGSEELWSQTAVQLRRDGHDVQASVVTGRDCLPRLLRWQSRASGSKLILHIERAWLVASGTSSHSVIGEAMPA